MSSSPLPSRSTTRSVSASPTGIPEAEPAAKPLPVERYRQRPPQPGASRSSRPSLSASITTTFAVGSDMVSCTGSVSPAPVPSRRYDTPSVTYTKSTWESSLKSPNSVAGHVAPWPAQGQLPALMSPVAVDSSTEEPDTLRQLPPNGQKRITEW